MIDLSALVPSEKMAGEDSQDTSLLRIMHKEASGFLSNFAWCEGLRQSFFGCGVGGVCAVFLFQIVPVSAEVDEWLWVVVGDIPPAYLVTDQATKASIALVLYVEEMRAWVSAVEAGDSIEELIPVNVPPTKENAKNLKTRLDCLEQLCICSD